MACMLGAYLTIFLLILAVVWLVVPQFIACIRTLVRQAPEAVEQLLSVPVIEENLPADMSSSLSGMDWGGLVTQLLELLKTGGSGLLANVQAVVSTVFSSMVTWLFSLIFSFYLLWGKEKLKGQCGRVLRAYLRPQWREKLLGGLALFDSCFHKYIVGQCTEAVILGLLCTLGMLLFRFPYAAMIGALVGVLALIPVAGAYIGAAVGAFMILSVSPVQALLFLVFIVVLQQLEGNLIYPRVVGSSVGLPGIWVLATVTVCGGLFGIAGMLVGVPVAAALYQALAQDVRRREAAGQEETVREEAEQEETE